MLRKIKLGKNLKIIDVKKRKQISLKNNKMLKIWLILATVVATLFFLMVGALMFSGNSKTNAYQSREARKKVLDIFAKESDQTKLKKVESSFGYSFEYSAEEFIAEGLVKDKDANAEGFKGRSYSSDELSEKRPYIIMNIIFSESGGKRIDNQSPGAIPAYTPTKPMMTISTSRQKTYFNRESYPDKFKSMSDIDAMVMVEKKKIKKTNPDAKIEVKDIKLKNVNYKLVKEHREVKLGGSVIANHYSYNYLTTHNERPYWIKVYTVTDDTVKYLSAFESIIASIKYDPPTEDSLVFNDNKIDSTGASLASTKKQTLEDTANIPKELEENTIINVVARNQPATVRVGAMYCLNVNYRASNGASFLIEGVCAGGIGSGSVVSSDGYIVTNGHVTDRPSRDTRNFFINAFQGNGARVSKNFQAYYDFVVKAGYIGHGELTNLINDAIAGNKEASDKIYGLINLVPKQNVSLSNEQKKYIIQTSNIPIKWVNNGDGPDDWEYNKTNISAKLIDSEVHDGKGLDRNSPKTDVAVLKVDSSLPTVEMGSIDNIGSKEIVTAIGFPAFVDEGINTKKTHTVPSVTQGYVESIITVAGGNKVFVSSAQIAGGNSGGPVFNKSGKQVGITTYGEHSKCPNVNDCFGTSYSRDIKDAKTMLSKNNIRIKAGGELTELWHRGLNEFLRGQYSVAAKTFTQLDSKYPDNYLVKKFIEVASAQEEDDPMGSNEDSTDLEEGYAYGVDNEHYGSASEADEELPAVGILIGVVVLGSVFVVIVVIIIITIIASSSKDRRHPPCGVQYGRLQQPQGSYQSRQHQQIPPQQPPFSGPPIQQLPQQPPLQNNNQPPQHQPFRPPQPYQSQPPQNFYQPPQHQPFRPPQPYQSQPPQHGPTLPPQQPSSDYYSPPQPTDERNRQ